jgi:cytochrome c
MIDFVPYATTLFDYTRRSMPKMAPGSLSDDEAYGVVAWMLYRNALIPREEVMDHASLPRVKMPALARFAFGDAAGDPADASR